MKSMEEMLAAAQKAAETIQKQMEDAQATLDNIEIEGAAGGGLVKIRATAKGRVIGGPWPDRGPRATGHASAAGRRCGLWPT